jgi:serine/threonine protein kinase
MSDTPDSTWSGTPDDDRTRVVVRELVEQLRVGDVLRDRFVIERVLGEGGMGQVFLARDRQAEKSNPFVALKVLGASFREHPQAFAALRREATQSRTLTHPNIVAVFDFDRAGDHVYMVMEYLKGQALDVLIGNRTEGSKITEVWPLIEGIARGLEYVHQKNIVHADVKPRNVMVLENGEVKVLDLGIARTLDENQAGSGTTRFNPDTLGALTPQYASPEMFEGQQPRPQDDIFALGCIAYELLTGKHPYDRRTAIEARSLRLAPKRPAGLKTRQWKAIKASLAMQRADRPATVTEFIRALSPHGSGTSAWPWIAVVAILFVVLGSQYFLGLTVSDEELIDDLLEQYPQDVANLADPSQVTEWEETAAFFHDMGTNHLAEGDIATGLNTLLTGSSTAIKSYKHILTRAESPVSRQQAGANVLRLVREVHAAAVSLETKPETLAGRISLICSGLKVMNEPELEQAFMQLVDSDANAVRENSVCAELLDRSPAT